MAFVVIGAPSPVFGGTVRWGVAGQPIGDFDLYSNGDIILDETFTYELGVFVLTRTGSPFTPAVENADLWNDHWVRVGEASGLDPFSGNYGAAVDAGGFSGVATGSQVYVWGFNSREIGFDLEWVLYTGQTSDGTPTDENWLSPGSGGFGDTILEWAPRTASDTVVGRISSTDPDLAGGQILFPAFLADNVVQTALVPEPSATVLALLGAAIFALRRGARKTHRAGR